MAVIQKIREKYGKVAAGVIVVALVGFILMDAASGRFGDLFGHNDSVVKINGDKISTKEYSLKMKEFETLYTLYSKTHTLDDATRAQMNEEAVKLMVYEKLANTQCDILGVTTTKEEEREILYSANADPMVQQFAIQPGQPVFANPETGQFDPQRVQAFEKQADQFDPTGKAREAWETVKTYVLHNARITKFNYLFINGVYTPKFVLDRQAGDADMMANISYVKIPLTAIADKDVTVTDNDLHDYMVKNPGRFRIDEPTRTIEYVSFDIKPSHDDTDRAVSALQQIKNDFAAATDNESVVNRNSEDKYAAIWVDKKVAKKGIEDSIVNMPAGTVVGPYFENNMYRLTKIIEKKDQPDSVKCRHILVRTKAQGKEVISDTVAKQRIDSIAAAVKAGADFKALALKYSDDDGSKKQGGEYNFSLAQKTGLSKEFGDFIFDGHTGENKIVKVDNDNYSGYHYIEILEQKNIGTAVKIASIDKPLYAGDNTVNSAYAKATEFAGNNTTAKNFDDVAKKQNLNKRIGDNIKIHDFQIQGIGPAREVVRWAYDAKAGDVSTVFTLASGSYVVAKLVSVQDKGLMAISEQIKPQLENIVKNDKKASLLLDKYKGVTNLQTAAQTAGVQVMHADSAILSASYLPNLGYVPAVLGYAFYAGLKLNAISPAIKAEDGIYLISPTQRWTKPANPAADQVMRQQRGQMEMQVRNMVGQQLQDVLINKAKVVYSPANM
jgi:peptidyl-prolyl cis-trans isomerase D